MPSLTAQNIVMRFGSFEALKNVSIDVESGAFVTLLGPSGCGKTTLLNVISGFLTPTSGNVIIDGKDVTQVRPEKRDTAMCFQSYALFPHLSVKDNMAFGPRQAGVEKGIVEQRVGDMIEQLGLSDHAGKLPNALSGGQQQRVALGRALAVAPGVILFDEPLSNLDAKLRDQVRAEIRALQQEHGFTAVYVTHDQSEALALSDKVFLMNQGKVEQEGTPSDIYFKPRTRFVADFIGAANIHRGEIKAGKLVTPFGVLKTNLADSSSATVCWRPEAVTLGGPLRGTVSSLAFQGAYSDLFVSSGGVTVRLQVPGTTPAAVNQDITFDIAPEQIVGLEDHA